MTTAMYARVSGAALLLVGILGFFVGSLFGIQFDLWHNVAHIALGTGGLMAGVRSRMYAGVVGPVYFLLGMAGFLVSDLGFTHLEMNENLIHLAVGAWGMLAYWMEK